MCGTKDTWNLGEQAQEFFVYATLGIIPKRMFEENKEQYKAYLQKQYNFSEDLTYEIYCSFLCSVQAYLDLARTCSYKENTHAEKKVFKDKVYSYLANNAVKETTEVLIKNVLDLAKQDIFIEEFKYGQAQKWVNMTRKYLFLIGIIKDDDGLHIPVDSYIIDALWREKDIPLKIQTGKREKDYKTPSDHVLAWSQWTNKEYSEDFVSKTKALGPSPMEWEHENWMRISEKRKGITDD